MRSPRPVSAGDVGTIVEPLSGETLHVEVMQVYVDVQDGVLGEPRLRVRPIFPADCGGLRPESIGCPMEAFIPKDDAHDFDWGA